MKMPRRFGIKARSEIHSFNPASTGYETEFYQTFWIVIDFRYLISTTGNVLRRSSSLMVYTLDRLSLLLNRAVLTFLEPWNTWTFLEGPRGQLSHLLGSASGWSDALTTNAKLGGIFWLALLGASEWQSESRDRAFPWQEAWVASASTGEGHSVIYDVWC